MGFSAFGAEFEARDSTSVSVVLGRLDPLVVAGLRVALVGVSVRLAADRDRRPCDPGSATSTVHVIDGYDALALTDDAVTRVPGTSILALAHRPSVSVGRRLLAHGISSVAVGAGLSDVRFAILSTALGQRIFISEDGSRQVREFPDTSVLTPRELEVLAWISRRETNRVIARALGVREHTVETHARSILRKLGVASRRDLIGIPATGPGTANH